MGVTGIGATLVDVAGRTLLQRTVTDDILTRVFGAIEALWMVGVGVGAALAPPLVAGVGLRGAFVVDGALLPLTTSLHGGRSHASTREASLKGSESPIRRSRSHR